MSKSRFTAFCTKSHTVHLTVQEIDTAGAKLPTVRALCGRGLKVAGVYSGRERVIEKFADEHKRLSLTHETGLCRICFDKQAEQAEERAARKDPFTGRAPLVPEGNSQLGRNRIHHQSGL